MIYMEKYIGNVVAIIYLCRSTFAIMCADAPSQVEYVSQIQTPCIDIKSWGQIRGWKIPKIGRA